MSEDTYMKPSSIPATDHQGRFKEVTCAYCHLMCCYHRKTCMHFLFFNSSFLALTLEPPEVAVYLKPPAGKFYITTVFIWPKNILFHCIMPSQRSLFMV